MIDQILSFVRPKLTVIIVMTGHFFSYTTRKEIIKNALKVIEIVQTTFKQMPHFFVEDNLITTLCSFHMQLHQSFASLLNDIEP